MIYKLSIGFLLLGSALSRCYYVSGAVVSLLVPFADPDQAITANFLGTDAEGHTSWSVGVGVTSGSFTNTEFLPGTLVADATNAHEVGAVNTVIDGITASATATGGCSVATATESGGEAPAACSFSGQIVGALSGTTTTIITSGYTSLQTLMAVQIPDTGSGAIPTAAATSRSGTASSTGSLPSPTTSTKNGALKERLGWGVAGAAGLVVVGLV